MVVHRNNILRDELTKLCYLCLKPGDLLIALTSLSLIPIDELGHAPLVSEQHCNDRHDHAKAKAGQHAEDSWNVEVGKPMEHEFKFTPESHKATKGRAEVPPLGCQLPGTARHDYPVPAHGLRLVKGVIGELHELVVRLDFRRA